MEISDLGALSPSVTREVSPSRAPNELIANNTVETMVGTQSWASVLDRASLQGAANESAPGDAMLRLEAMFISQLLQQAFSFEESGLFGEGTSGAFYSSVFSDAVAEKMIRHGGLGIADTLAAD